MRLASIDLGSNSFRLEIVRVMDEELVCEKYLKEGVRIAAGLDTYGNLTEEVQEKALAVLATFHEHIKDFSPTHVRAVGTQTLRIAKNTEAFLERAQKVLGFPIEVLRGQEEARLVFKGCSHCLPASTQNRLIIDIGGASTELVIGSEYEALTCESFHIGCVNTTLEHFPDGVLSEESFQNAYLSAKAEFIEARERFHRKRWQEAYGSSGSMEALCALVAGTSGEHDMSVTRADLESIKNKLIAHGHVNALDLELAESRKSVIAGGLAVLIAAFDVLAIERIFFSPGALRRGVSYATLERLIGIDIRHASLLSLLRQTRTDAVYSQRIGNFATDLLRQILPETSMRAQQMLHWAAMAHLIGKCISPNGYHHHGHYLLKNCHLSGFSKSDQDWLASIVLGHRGNLAKVQKHLADPFWRTSLLALRLTVLLANEMDFNPTEKMTVTPIGDTAWRVKLIDHHWFNQHPLTIFLLKREVQVWNKLKYQLDIDFH